MDAWEITVCPDCGQRVSGGYPVCTVDDKPHYAPDKTESVEVVRAADHQGAVALVEQARGCVTAALNCTAHPWHGSDDARRWLMQASDLLGGR